MKEVESNLKVIQSIMGHADIRTTMDITYLNGPIKGQFYYLYLFTDLFSRDIVGWEVWDSEDATMLETLY